MARVKPRRRRGRTQKIRQTHQTKRRNERTILES